MNVAGTGLTLVHTRAQLREHRLAMAGSVGVVMTMGALHAGHGALARQAVAENNHVIATIFVNPLQFGAGEDLERYPRTLSADLEILQECGVSLVFAPSVAEMYPHGEPLIHIAPGPAAKVLEGAHRPGHFQGVLTVVAKLLNLTSPTVAYFGQKDAQQLGLIQQMVHDLDIPARIQAVPTVRDADGLALSSRNRYLTPADRECALALSRALQEAERKAAAGESAVAIEQAAAAVLTAEPGCAVDYAQVVHPATFEPVEDDYRGQAVFAIAARVGSTRLIDNCPLTVDATRGTNTGSDPTSRSTAPERAATNRTAHNGERPTGSR